MTFNLGFHTKYILNPGIMLFHHVLVLLKGLRIIICSQFWMFTSPLFKVWYFKIYLFIKIDFCEIKTIIKQEKLREILENLVKLSFLESVFYTKISVIFVDPDQKCFRYYILEKILSRILQQTRYVSNRVFYWFES